MASIDQHLDLLSSLTLPESYPAIDAYRDFRNTFLESEHGRRTLKQILEWGNINKPTAFGVPLDTHRTMQGEGARVLCLKIMDTMMVEPPQEQPTQQVTRSEEDG